MTSRGLFTPIFVPEAVQDAVSDQAWLRAMLDVEVALARAEASVGVISAEAAEAIAHAAPDLDGLGIAARESGNPVVPLAKALRGVAEEAHFGATSQDVLDSAARVATSSLAAPRSSPASRSRSR